MDIEEVGKEIVDSVIQVHRSLGPGLFESVYQRCLVYELLKRGLKLDTERTVPIRYGNVLLNSGFRIDILVEGMIVIENKAVSQLLPLHEAQLITYLRLSNCRLGYLLNWNVALMKNGIRRFVN